MTFYEWWDEMEPMFIGYSQLKTKDIAEAAFRAGRCAELIDIEKTNKEKIKNFGYGD